MSESGVIDREQADMLCIAGMVSMKGVDVQTMGRSPHRMAKGHRAMVIQTPPYPSRKMNESEGEVVDDPIY